jgi:hypothetical protein
VNVIFDQSSDTNTTGVYELRANRFEIVLDSATTPTNPTIATTVSSTSDVVDSIDRRWDNENGGTLTGVELTWVWGSQSAVAFDRGDADGNCAVAYIDQNTDSGIDPDSNVVVVDPRAYFWDGTNNQLIGSPAPSAFPEGNRLDVGAGTQQNPAGDATALTTSRTPLIAVQQTSTGANIFWNQLDNGGGGHSRLCSRYWDRTSANLPATVAPALVDQFLPVLNDAGGTTTITDPFFIDDQYAGDASAFENSETVGASTFGITGRGTGDANNSASSEIYFSQGQHLWWNQWNGSSWLTVGGFSDPQIVDHDSDANVISYEFDDRPGANAGCSDVKIMTVWTRRDLNDNPRLLVRPR